MDKEFKEWFVAERARALAGILLTRRTDLDVKDAKEVGGPDYLVRIRSEARPGQRPFGVYLAATMPPVAFETANKQLQSVLERVRSQGPFHYPVCVFFFMVKEDRGYYTWAVEPMVTSQGQPKLKAHTEAHCRNLDNESLDEIVSAVSKWYDAFERTITA